MTGSIDVAGFEDTGKGKMGMPSDTLSFSVKDPAGPETVLSAISKRSVVRDRCSSGRAPATPREMFACGYRVAQLSARVVLAECAKANAEVQILRDGEGNDYETNGHLQIIQGHLRSDTWARHAVLLTEAHTFPHP